MCFAVSLCHFTSTGVVLPCRVVMGGGLPGSSAVLAMPMGSHRAWGGSPCPRAGGE